MPTALPEENRIDFLVPEDIVKRDSVLPDSDEESEYFEADTNSDLNSYRTKVKKFT